MNYLNGRTALLLTATFSLFACATDPRDQGMTQVEPVRVGTPAPMVTQAAPAWCHPPEEVWEPVPFDPTPLEEAIIKKASTCVNASYTPDPYLLLRLLRMEETIGVPESLRGMTLAAACTESGFNIEAKGDRKFDARGRPLAIGLLQLWPWWVKEYEVDRQDPVEAATAWLRHIERQVKKVKKNCYNRDDEKLWVNAWVHAIRARKEGGRCGEIPKHYHRLKRWRRAWDEVRTATTEPGDGKQADG